MAKIRTLISIATCVGFAYLSRYLFNLTYGIYHGVPLEQFEEYPVQQYFFGWIGYALSAVCALIALYSLYYLLSMLLAFIKSRGKKVI